MLEATRDTNLCALINLKSQGIETALIETTFHLTSQSEILDWIFVWHETGAIFKLKFWPHHWGARRPGVGIRRVKSGTSPRRRTWITTLICLTLRASHLSFLSIFWFNPDNNTVKSEAIQTQNFNDLPQVIRDMSCRTKTKPESLKFRAHSRWLPFII